MNHTEKRQAREKLRAQYCRKEITSEQHYQQRREIDEPNEPTYKSHFGYPNEPELSKTPTIFNLATIENWVSALRGDYKNRRSKMWIMRNHRKGTFTAIGVLCDVIEPNSWEWDGQVYRHDVQCLGPSLAFLKRCGIPKELAVKVDIIDGRGKENGFAEVANYLERYYLKANHKTSVICKQ